MVSMESVNSLLLVALTGASAFLGVYLYRIVMNVKRIIALRKHYKQNAIIEKSKEENSCSAKNDIHKWDQLRVGVVDGFTGEMLNKQDTQFCENCGVISGTDLSFTKKGLDDLAKRREAEEEGRKEAENLEKLKQEKMQAIFERLLATDEGDLAKEDYFHAGADALIEVEEELAQMQFKKAQEKMKALADEILSNINKK